MDNSILEDYESAHFWPAYIERYHTYRTLAYWTEHGTIISEYNCEYFIHSFDDYVKLVFSHDLLVFCRSVLDFPYLDELVDSGPETVFCNGRGVPVAARLKGTANGKRNTTRWLVQSSSWGQKLPSLEFLKHLRDLYTHAGIGTPATSGGLGQALMRRTWQEQFGELWTEHRHQLPPARCERDLKTHGTGARSDDMKTQKQTYDMVYELDQRNAYAAAFVLQPTGKTFSHAGKVKPFVKHFSRCTVALPHALPLGPFPVREPEKPVCYPTRPGTYEAWLWNDEISLCKEEGCKVQVHGGWGWKETTTDTKAWVELMDRLRNTAPSHEVEQMLKLAIVAGIGRHGVQRTRLFLVSEEHAVAGDVQVAGETIDGIGMAYRWFVHEVANEHPSHLQHWFNHTLMQCRLALFRFAKPYAIKEQLIATNTDAVYVTSDADVSGVLDKAELSSRGEWGKSTLHNARFRALRYLESDEKNRTPGMSQ